jgi:hypothetical protein
MLATCWLLDWHTTIKLYMDKGGKASAMAHNNQIVNGRGGREMEEEIEGGDHKGDNNTMALAAMASAEKGGSSNGGRHYRLCGTMVAVNGGGGDGGHRFWRRRSSSTVAMAVFVDGIGKGGCRQGCIWA